MTSKLPPQHAAQNLLYTRQPNFVFGFHGCDLLVQQKVINGHAPLLPSENSYDWLGHGIYFWESNPKRALEFAQMLTEHPERGSGHIKQPAVIGAIIDLGHCLNLMESSSLSILKFIYHLLADECVAVGEQLPDNISPNPSSDDLIMRKLDCAVIQRLHRFLNENGDLLYHTVRGLFFEGKELYPHAGFREQNHIQICVCNPNCIKGYFLPRGQDTEYPIP